MQKFKEKLKNSLPIRKQRYKIQPYDSIKCLKKIYSVIGVHCKRSRAMVKDKNKKVSIGIKKIDWVFHSQPFIWGISLSPRPEIRDIC